MLRGSWEPGRESAQGAWTQRPLGQRRAWHLSQGATTLQACTYSPGALLRRPFRPPVCSARECQCRCRTAAYVLAGEMGSPQTWGDGGLFLWLEPCGPFLMPPPRAIWYPCPQGTQLLRLCHTCPSAGGGRCYTWSPGRALAWPGSISSDTRCPCCPCSASVSLAQPSCSETWGQQPQGREMALRAGNLGLPRACPKMGDNLPLEWHRHLHVAGWGMGNQSG